MLIRAMEQTIGMLQQEILEDMEVMVILEVGMEDMGMAILGVVMEAMAMVTPEVDMEVTTAAMVQGEDMEGILEVDMEDQDITGDELWIILSDLFLLF